VLRNNQGGRKLPDELEQTQDEDSPEAELVQLRTRVSELEEALAQREEELGRVNAHITELEQATAESAENLNSLNDTLKQAVSSYRAVVIQSNPGVVEELISGDSIDEINASLERAKSLVSRVRGGLEEEAAKARVPTGAPQRTPIDLSALSPAEKIRYAISQGGKK